MDPSFGARLRSQRESRHVDLAAIAAETKIKLALLESLERDDLSQWPQGIFKRAYIRAYARAIGLDPQTLVREFLELYPDPVELDPHAPPETIDPDPDPGARLRRLVTSAIAAVPAFLQRGQRSEVAYETAQAPARNEVRESSRVDPQPRRGVTEPPAPIINLPAIADLCTRLSQVVDASQIRPLLGSAARILDAVGVVVWSWDPRAAALAPSLAHGYSEALLASMPTVGADADHAIAATFRCSESSIVHGDAGATGAVVVPLLTPGGCSGVLAVEVRNGGERHESVRAAAAIVAAQLATLFGPAPIADAVNA